MTYIDFFKGVKWCTRVWAIVIIMICTGTLWHHKNTVYVKASVPQLIWNIKGYLILKGGMNRKPVTHGMILGCHVSVVRCDTDLG